MDSLNDPEEEDEYDEMQQEDCEDPGNDDEENADGEMQQEDDVDVEDEEYDDFQAWQLLISSTDHGEME